MVSGNSIAWAAGASLLSAGVIAFVRFKQRQKPRAVVLGLLSVAVACLIVLYTGRAQDILLPRIVSNAASALVWAGFIVFRRPLLGLIVGGLLGQKTRWRRDPHLLRAYSAASWVWVAMYALRVAILTPFWNSDEERLAVVAGGVAQVALSWPLLVLCLIASGWVIRAVLPDDHPGIRHPLDPAESPAPEKTAP
ncbi:membrane associated rhomboid family serine protease [Glycomyces algeriensis]|nr:membrane associated rhomboid family serine protease [Glycomyces algeriensis]